MEDKNGADVIVAEAVTKVYDDHGVPVEAVKAVDLTITAGEFTAIVGPSGSGKTTFLNVISGLDQATSGRVLLDGQPISEMSGRALSDFRRDHVGLIFQAYNLIPVLTVVENVEYVMLLQGVPRRERRKRVREMLATVGLADQGHRFPPKLSGGQQQRVAVARAMVTRPSLVLADEPTANLDSKTGAGLLDMMRELNQSTGMTFVFSTHDQMIMERASRLVTLKDGRVTGDETRN
jgi:putative ABC transport system ATP-binding protein